MALPPIVAKITAETSGLTKGLADANTRLSTFAKVGAGAAAAVAAGLVALTKASMSNIDALAKQARSLGLTTAAFQKMSLVANEAGVETGKLSSMLGLMQRSIVELQSGTAKQVETFRALGLSISELQGLTPDEQFAKIAESLDGITDPATKTALAMEVFGRSGREAINMLSGYSEAAANAADFQARFGIAVSQDVSDKVEKANDAVGRLGMVFQGFGNQLAGLVAGPIEATANGLIRVADALFGTRTKLEEFFGSIEKAKAILGEDVFAEIFGDPQKIAEAADALDDVAFAAERAIGVSRNLEQEIRSFAAGLEMIEQTAAADAVEQIANQVEILRQRFESGELSMVDFVAKMKDIQSRAEGLVEELGRINGSDMSAIIARMGALGDAIAAAAAEARNLAASLPGGDLGMTEGTPLSGDVSGLMPPSVEGVTSSPRPPPAPPLLGEPDSKGTGSGTGKGGGGLQDYLAQRLETLIEGLRTEAEIVAEWYAEQQQTLEDALAAKMLTEQEYMEYRERLEQEHQDRLSKIREMANSANLSMVLGAGEEILNAIGQTNKKALKVAKVFGAAQALISAYQGAAEALKLPFPKNLAAAATVLAKGISFVSAIRGVNESGAGGGGRGGGAGGASAPQQQNVQTLNFTVQNDPFGFGANIVRQIAAQLNENARNGGTIRATVAS